MNRFVFFLIFLFVLCIGMLNEVRFVCVDDLVNIRFLVSYIVEFLLEIFDVGIFLEFIFSFFVAILFLLNFLL